MTEEYTIAPARVPLGCKSPPSHEVTCRIGGREAWSESLSFDMVALAALDLEQMADRLVMVADKTEVSRALMVAELYYQNFCDGPNSPPSRNLNRRQIKRIKKRIAAVATEILGPDAVADIQSHAVQKYLACVCPLDPR